MGFILVYPLHNNFSRGLSGYRLVHFVLHGSKKLFCFYRVRRVVHSGCRNVGNLLINHALTGPDLSNFFQEFLEISSINASAVFKTVTVNGKTFKNIIFQFIGCPGSKLGASSRVYPVADSDDGLQAIKCEVSSYLTITLLANYREFLGSCCFIQFSFFEISLSLNSISP